MVPVSRQTVQNPEAVNGKKDFKNGGSVSSERVGFQKKLTWSWGGRAKRRLKRQ